MFPEFGDKFDYNLWRIRGTCSTFTWKKDFFFFRGSFYCKGPFLQPLLVEFIPRATRWDELPWLARMAHFEREKTWCWFKTSWKIRYTQVNEHNNGKWTHWLEDVFPVENGDIHSYVSLPEGMSNQMITSEIWLFEPKNHPLEKKIIFHPPPFLDSMFVVRGVESSSCVFSAICYVHTVDIENDSWMQDQKVFSHTTHLQFSNIKQGRISPTTSKLWFSPTR